MTVYALLRMVHGYWRWAVLLSAVFMFGRALSGLIRRREWTPLDQKSGRALAGIVDLQVLLGLVLYFGFSPFWPAVRESFGEAMKNETTRFFGIEHQTAMLLAAIAVRVGWVRAKKLPEARRKFRAVLVSTAIFFLFAAWAIPWPWRAVGRPLFRMD